MKAYRCFFKAFAEFCRVITVIIVIGFFFLFIIRSIIVLNEDNNRNDKIIKDSSSICCEYKSDDTEDKLTEFKLSIIGVYKLNGSYSGYDFSKATQVSTVTVGDTIAFELRYDGPIDYFNLTTGHIVLKNFSGSISLHKSEDDQRKIFVIISDIYTPIGNENISITINAGTAISTTGELVNSQSFEVKIYQKDLIRFVLWAFPDSNSVFTLLAAILGVLVENSFFAKMEGKN